MTRHMPMRLKLMLLTGVVTAFALVVAGAVSIRHAYRGSQQALTYRLQTEANNAALSTAAALTFDDQQAALKSLQALAGDSAILGAEITRADGSEFTSHVFGKQSVAQLRADRGLVRVHADIDLDGRIGGVEIWASGAELESMLLQQLAVLLTTILASLGAAMVAASRLQRFISGPIVKLARTATDISVSRDYSVRAEYRGTDEVGQLVASFNDMLAQIEAQSAELQAHKTHLERTVEERTADLAGALKDAQAAARAKAEFLANMSHEIRTPMNGVIGMLDLMDAESLDPQRRSMLETARNSAEALLAIINDVLDFSKIDAGKLTLEQIDVELRPLAEEVATLFSRQAHDKNVEVTCLVEASVPAVVRTDPTRLRQVLANLLGNAIKFTERGEVGLVVRCERIERGVAELEFVVNDTGIGMNPQALASLFQSFTQADSSTTRRFGGTGLGLAICKRLLDAMHGAIVVHSAVGQGSSFSIKLSLPLGLAPATKQRADLSRLRALIVDDNATNRLVLEHYATALRLQYRCAASAAEALSLAREATAANQPFDLVLLDYQMPEVDGLEFLKLLRADPNIPPMECIVLSSLGDRVAGSDGLNVFAWLNKPVRLNQLYSAIATSAGLTSSWERYRPVSQPEPPLTPAREGFDARVLLVEDNAVNRQVAARLLATMGIQPVMALNGIEALERLRAEAFDIVLMDCQMPLMDGYQATCAIRALELAHGRKRVPIVAMTANAMQGDRERCIDAGMDDYLAKPIKRDSLSAALGRWLPLRASTTGSPPPSAVAAVRAIVDPQALAHLRELFEDDLAEVIDTYLNDTPRQLDQMTSALASADAATLVRAAHSLRASSHSVGATLVSELATRLESHARRGGSAEESKSLITQLRTAHAAAAPILHDARDSSAKLQRSSQLLRPAQ